MTSVRFYWTPKVPSDSIPDDGQRLLGTGQDINEGLDIQEVKISIAIAIRFGLKLIRRQQHDEGIDVQKIDAAVQVDVAFESGRLCCYEKIDEVKIRWKDALNIIRLIPHDRINRVSKGACGGAQKRLDSGSGTADLPLLHGAAGAETGQRSVRVKISTDPVNGDVGYNIARVG